MDESKVCYKVFKHEEESCFSSFATINWKLRGKIGVEFRPSQLVDGIWTQLTDGAGLACGGFPHQRRGGMINSEAVLDATNCATPEVRKVRQELAAQRLTFGKITDAESEVTEDTFVTMLDVAYDTVADNISMWDRQQTEIESFSALNSDGFGVDHIIGQCKNNSERMFANSRKRLLNVAARSRQVFVALCCTSGLLVSLPGCTFIAKDGPEGSAISSGAVVSVPPPSTRLPYAQVSMSPLAIDVADRFSAIYVRKFGSFRSDKGVSDVTIGAGDVVSVTVFETESGGLFVPKDAASRPGNFVQIPNQQVDASGNISVPFAGKVPVIGRKPETVDRDIASKLKGRAIEPQVIVSVVEHRSNEVTVLGDVSAGTRFPLDPGGMRLTEAIARAGGSKNPSYEERVDVKRRGAVQSAELSAVVKDPAQDIRLRPGDLVYLERRPRVFMVFGATPPPGAVGGLNNRRFTFEDDNMSLTEGVAKAGGLDNLRANPNDFYLLRYEFPGVLSALGIDPRPWAGLKRIPVVYKANFSEADGFFLASKFSLRDQDVIFVGEALAVDINKVLATVDAASGAAYNASLAAEAAR